jgi:hypothetical protein
VAKDKAPIKVIARDVRRQDSGVLYSLGARSPSAAAKASAVEAYNPLLSSWAFEGNRFRRGHRTLSSFRDGTKTLSGAGS